jgi:elongation factor G
MNEKRGAVPNSIKPRGSRCIALVGPFQSGKTTLLEAILARTGAIARPGSVDNGTSVGDASKEARHHKMSVEATFATTTFMDDSYTFVDCPGSIEFIHDMRAVLPAVDAAVVVCEADEKKVPQLQLILRELEDQNIPHFLFLNKIDKADRRVRETLKLLQPASRVPLLLRQIPIWKNEIVAGFVDLALERAFVYKEHAASEQLLEDIEPPRDKIFDDLSKELREGIVCPVLLGAAIRSNGVLRLLKALRHEAPGIAETAARLGIKHGYDAAALVLKTYHTPHGGKMSVVRLITGDAGDGTTFSTPTSEVGRISGVFTPMGLNFAKRGQASAGDTVAFGKLDGARTGDTLSSGPQARRAMVKVTPSPPVLAIAVQAKEHKDDVKLGAAFTKLTDEDPSLTVVHNAESHEVVIKGQGEMHLRVATERLADRYGVPVTSRPPSVGYRETIRKPVTLRGRHKKQSGGHGAFGDVVLEIKPLPRSSGFKFEDRIVGGVVPRNYIPAVDEGVQDALKQGPLGFPVVDVAVALTDGSYHTVDSSDMAFRIAGRMAMVEGLPQCQPVLLEPIYLVEIVCPSEATARINAILSGRRGHILGFDTREGWDGWDTVRAQMAEAEIGDLIIEVRSATAGVGSFTFTFDHLAELTGRTADQIVAARKNAAAA